MHLEIAGLGNALMDALVVVDDESLLGRYGAHRGATNFVDHEGWESAYDSIRHLKVRFDSGGSCANAVATAGLLGAEALLCGLVGDDQMGRLYRQKLHEACGRDALKFHGELATGKVLSVISEADAERTMFTDLGAAIALTDFGEAFAAALKQTKVGLFEGYMLPNEPSRNMVLRGMEAVHDGGGLVALDVSDPFVVAETKDILHDLLTQHVDIVFLNAEEARALTGERPEVAIRRIGDAYAIRTVVVKRGGAGSLVLEDGELHTIGIHPVKAIDTTGAGDAYAGGYLYGVVRGWPADACGRLAASVAGLTVSQIGAVVKDRDALARARAEALDGTGPWAM